MKILVYGNGMESRITGYWNIMKKHPELTSLFLVFFLLLGIYWKGIHGGLSTQQAAIPKTFIKGHFQDVYFGSLSSRDRIIRDSDISLVFYYAPWCLDSVRAAEQFTNVTEQLSKQLSWIAVNCWWDKGECHGQMKMERFPQVDLHHKLLHRPIHYKGPLQQKHLEGFLSKVLQPIEYLGTEEELLNFLTQNKAPVIGYFGNHFQKRNIPFKTYFKASLINLNQFPDNHVTFGITTNHETASYAGLTINNIALYSNKNLVKKLTLTGNTTSDSMLNWISKNEIKYGTDFVIKHSSTVKSNEIYLSLKSGPTLISFLTQKDHINIIQDIATRYKSLKFLNCQCINKFCNICVLDDIPVYNWSIMTSSIKCGRSCVHMTSHFNLQRYEVCCNLQEENPVIDGLYWKTNRTLRFIVLNANNHAAIAKQFNLLNGEGVIIVDKDDHYKMNSVFSRKNIEDFIMEYTNGIIEYSNELPYAISTDFLNSVTDINTVNATNFEQKVMHSNKDSLIYYQSSSCGFCSTSSHSIMQLLHFISSNNFLQVFVVDHELPQVYDTHVYPNLILFLGNRTTDSVTYPHHLPYSLPNIIRFLLRHASPKTKAFIVLQFCNSIIHEHFYEICKLKEKLR